MLGLGLGTSKGGMIDALALVTNTKSVLFDQTDDYIHLGDLDIVTDNFTISGWAKPTDVSDFGVIISKYDDNTTYKADRVFRIIVQNVCICTIKTSSGDNLATSTTTTALSDGEWFHFAFTNDGSNLKGYINGELEDTDSTSGGDLNTSNQNFLIGAQYVNTVVDNEFGGNIDEIGIWNEALTADEITQIYNGGSATLDLSTDSGDYSSSSNIQAWWRMGGSIDAFSNSGLTGIGLIADYTNATLGTALVPNLSDDGGYDGNDASNWELTTASEWTVNTNTSTAFEATTDSDISGTAEARCYMSEDNSSLSARLPIGIYKVTGTLSTTGTLPSMFCRFVSYSLGSYTNHNLSVGDFEFYIAPTSVSVNHYFMFKTTVEGNNFKLENVKLEPVNGNAGITVNTSSSAIETDTP